MSSGRFARCFAIRFDPDVPVIPRSQEQPTINVVHHGSIDGISPERALLLRRETILITSPGSAASGEMFGEEPGVLSLEVQPATFELCPGIRDLFLVPGRIESGPAVTLARRIARELTRRDDGTRSLMIDALALEMIALLLRSRRSVTAFAKTSWITRAIEHLDQHFLETIEVGHLAALFQVHPSHFGRVFKREMQCSVAQYVQYLRTEKAMDLLRHSEMSISEVADRCAFSDQAHLTKVFRKTTGTTPAAYRREVQSAGHPRG